MSRIRARLEKLEAISSPSARVVVVLGRSDAEHEAEIEALKARGAATERDLFVCIMRFVDPPAHKGTRHEAL
jgi:hypothetical protein